jgi:phage-related holin
MQYILSLFKYFWAKVLLTIPIGIFIVNEQHFVIVYALLLMVFIDSILGIWVSLKFKVFNSHRLRRISNKIAMYSLALASVWILACVSPSIFGWSFQAIGIFLILTELFSNFEKLSLLGLEIPTKLLSKLNTNFYDFYFGNEKEREDAVNFILSKGEHGCSHVKIVKKPQKNV